MDDHAAVREALVQLLRGEGLSVLGQAGDLQAGLDLVRARRPDVAVIDIRLRGESGIVLTERLVECLPSVAVLLYTGELLDPGMVDGLLRRGARGVALKTGDARELTDAIRRVATGERYVDPVLRVQGAAGGSAVAAVLSEREREVLSLVADGMTNASIAQALFLSPHTVRAHVRNCLRKLGVNTRAQAVLALERASVRIPGIKP